MVRGNNGYTRAISPLRRRHEVLVTRWQIKRMLLHNKRLFSSEEMQTTFDHIGAKEQRWKWIEQAHAASGGRRLLSNAGWRARVKVAFTTLENMIARVTAVGGGAAGYFPWDVGTRGAHRKPGIVRDPGGCGFWAAETWTKLC